jgi:PAS domain S-box-containing protein
VLPLSWLIARRFVAPIVALEGAAQRFAEGEQEVEVPIRSGDELGRLSSAFNQMVVAIRRQTEVLIRGNEELESIRSVIVRWDPSGEILFVNPYGRELFGFDEGDLVGRSIVGTIVSDSEESRRYLRQLVEGIVDDPESYENEESKSSRRTGEPIRMAWRNKPVLGDRGELREILTIGIDITERHRIEQQIKEQKNLLEDTLESLTHPFYVIDVNDYSIEVANSAARRLGISGKSTCHALTHDSPHPCDSREDPCPLEQIKRTGEPVVVEHIHRDAEGNRMFVEVHGYPIFDSDGNLIKMIEYSLDITDRKSMELDLAGARDAAEAANRAKSAFLANMSHELRTPMNAIIGYSEMLAEDAEEEGREETVPDLRKITAAGKHLLALINDILDLSKIEAGRMDLYLERFGLRQMLEEALATVAPLVAKNQNQLVSDLGDDLGEIRADLTKLRQIVFNLLSNAAKFTENGTITLAAAREQRQDADWITIRVSDTGIGIAQDKLPQVFEEFSQADGSTTRDYGGTGLGLSISQRFCRMMGGSISVASELGEGSTFTIQVPAAVDALRAAKAVTGSEEKGTDAIPEGVHPILVIDDDADSRDLLRRAFEADGFVVAAAASGEEGLELARRLRPGFITLDVMMPGMDGWAVLKEIKADPALSQIPVAMISIVGEEDIGYSLGAVEHLVKPVDRDRLRELANLYAGPSGGGHALVVDDDETTRALFRRALEGDRWTVVEAENGAAALQRVSESRPDLILLDLMMPIMDGFEFLVELRKREDAAAIPVIVVTAKDLTEDDRRCLSGGVARIVQKGALTRQELLAQVRSLVGQHCAPA